MIDRENWQLVKRYLQDMDQVYQMSLSTITTKESYLRRVLEWADETPFSAAPAIRPSLPRYLSDSGRSPRSNRLICSVARNFFEWLRLRDPRRFKFSDLWLKTITVKNDDNPADPDAYSLDEVRMLLNVPTASLIIQRDQAAIALIFLGAVRVGALTTLPIKNIDLEAGEVKQWPESGVRTKRRKRATTFLLQIPDLLAVCIAWDQIVRAALPLSAPWYAAIAPDGELRPFVPGTPFPDPKHRSARLNLGLKQLCEAAGVRYRTSHKLRHGFAVYALLSARDIADMEAVSKNMMHTDLKTTMGVYAVLNQEQVRSRIKKLGVEGAA